jgi:hypothetical protein
MESYELEAQPDLCDRCGKKPATDVDGPCDWRDDDDGEFSLADLIGSDADPAEPGQ